ncbi:hypothetical protein [Pararhodobacter sp. CCB-MM2]|uniref:hypothetical protein n=1 Tax=Pararhodobacter sp. CCB-MM2 TaxID=1786003 RepID=UPI00083008DF|nr:hypothetical protein [Pararhodobacter sp. CCB-MM2]
MPRIKHLAVAISALLALPLAASAQTPARFPTIPEAELEHALRNAYCAETVSTIARSLGEYDGWRGYGVRICSPDYEPREAVVAWYRRQGERVAVVTLPDGRPLPMPEEARYYIGDQQIQATIFGTRSGNQALACYVSRFNRRSEPFATAFCQEIRG